MSRTLTPRSGRTSGRGRTPSTRRRHSVSRARGRRVLPRAPSSAHDALAAPPRRRARARSPRRVLRRTRPLEVADTQRRSRPRGGISGLPPRRDRGARASVRGGDGRARATRASARAAARGRTRGVDRARPAASRAPRRGVSFRRRSPIPQLPEGSTGWRPGRRRVIGFRPSRIRRRGRGGVARGARGDQRVRRARVGRRALAAAVVVVAAPGCSAQTVFTTLADLKNAVATCNSNGGLCNEASTWDVSQLTSLNGAFQG